MRLKNFDYEGQVAAASRAAAIVKLSNGVSNNATLLVLLHAHDQVKPLPRYRGHVKRLFRQVFDDWKAYECKLKYARENRMFHVDDLTPEHKKKYGDISDTEYFDFWQGCGFTAWEKTKPFITSLQNKYRLSLIQHDIKFPEQIAWVMTGQAALQICCAIWKSNIELCVKDFGLHRNIAEDVFGQFRLDDIAKRWERAMFELSPNANYNLDSIEERNIGMGIDQLFKQWAAIPLSLQSYFDTVDDYSEVFRTQGYAKREKKEIRKLLNDL